MSADALFEPDDQHEYRYRKIPSLMFEPCGEAPRKNGPMALKAALAAFDGVQHLHPRLLAQFDERTAPACPAIVWALREAAKIVREADPKRLLDFGRYPRRKGEAKHIEVTSESWKVPYGVTVGFADMPYLGQTAFVLHGADNNRLIGMTIVGRVDDFDGLTVEGHASVYYEPAEPGDVRTVDGFEPRILSDPSARRSPFPAVIAALWLWERYRRGLAKQRPPGSDPAAGGKS